MERLIKRTYDAQRKMYRWKATNHVIATFNGNNMPESITLHGGFIRIAVRPFVEAVSQCHQCYCHWKRKCKKKRACVVCGEKYHGTCEKREKCVNCKKDHRANDRKCSYYQIRVEENKIRAEEKVTRYETRRIIEESRLPIRSERKTYERATENSKITRTPDIINE